MNYKFSVLIPVYDLETCDNLKQCLDSVFNQTIKPDEVVVVLDGLINKDLNNILNNYNVRIIKNKEKIGLSKALQIGLKKCKYNLVARMDSDDISLPNRFELELEEFKKDLNLDLVGGQIIEFNEKTVRKKRMVPLNKEDIIKFSKKRNPFNHMTVMFKKNKILDIGGYEKIDYFEDYYLWIKAIKKDYNVKNIENVVVKARCGNNHIKRRGTFKYIKYIYNFQKLIYKEGYINYFEFLRNIFIRSSVSIVPNRLRYYLYNIFLRK